MKEVETALEDLAIQIARNKDEVFLNEHISDNFMGIDLTGDRITKAGILKLKLAPQQREIPRRYKNFNIMLCAGGAAAVVIFDAVFYPGEAEEAVATFTQVYEQVDEGWRAVSSQVFVYHH